MPATALTYRNNVDKPHCEIALANGERVRLQLDKYGLVIEQQPVIEQTPTILFKGDANLVTDMCMAFAGSKPASRQTARELLASIVTQPPSAHHVREAFKAASKAV